MIDLHNFHKQLFTNISGVEKTQGNCEMFSAIYTIQFLKV